MKRLLCVLLLLLLAVGQAGGSLTADVPRAQSVSAGGTDYAFTFPIWTKYDIQVYSGSSLQTVDTDYTVTFVAGDESGGTVTMLTAPTAGTVMTIVRNLSQDRTSDLGRGPLLLATIDSQFDRLTAMVQDLEERGRRALKYDVHSTATFDGNQTDFAFPTPTAGAVLGYDASGNATSLSLAADATWDGLTDLASTASGKGSDLVANAIRVINATDYGADPTGVASSVAALALAETAAGTNGTIYLPAGTYLIDSTISPAVRYWFAEGAKVSVSSGVTLTVDSILAADNQIIISGDGTVVARDSRYSVAWFSGATLDLKWDACRRGFTTSVWKRVVLPEPRSDDPAYYTNAFWKVAAPIEFDDPENHLIFEARGKLRATADTFTVLEFSPTNKTENITFPLGIWIEGASTYTGVTAVTFHGGARIKFAGVVTCYYVNKGIVFLNDVDWTDEIQFDFLEVTRFRTSAWDMSLTNPAYSTIVNFFFTNGGHESTTPTSYWSLVGPVRDFTVLRWFENKNASLSDATARLIHINSNANGSPKTGIHFVDIYAVNSTAKVVEIDCDGTNRGSVTVDQVSRADTTNAVIDADYSADVRIGQINCTRSQTVAVSANSQGVRYIDGPPSALGSTGTTTNLRVQGRQYARNAALAQDTAFSVSASAQGDLVFLTSDNANNTYAAFLVANGLIVQIVKGSDVTFTTGVLTGTTGGSAVNVSYSGGKVYIENRLSGTRQISVSVIEQ